MRVMPMLWYLGVSESETIILIDVPGDIFGLDNGVLIELVLDDTSKPLTCSPALALAKPTSTRVHIIHLLYHKFLAA
jgi:hypothetical protein